MHNRFKHVSCGLVGPGHTVPFFFLKMRSLLVAILLFAIATSQAQLQYLNIPADPSDQDSVSISDDAEDGPWEGELLPPSSVDASAMARAQELASRAQGEALLGGLAPPSTVGAGVLQSQQAVVPSVRPSGKGRLIKPHISQETLPHLPNFQTFEPGEDCEVIQHELENDMVHSANHWRGVALGGILTAISKEGYTDEEKASADKNAAVSFQSLGASVLDAGIEASNDPSAMHLFPYLLRIATCRADSKTGRTIYQKLIETGMLQSLKSTFVKKILSQDTLLPDGTVYQPHLSLDSVRLCTTQQ